MTSAGGCLGVEANERRVSDRAPAPYPVAPAPRLYDPYDPDRLVDPDDLSAGFDNDDDGEMPPPTRCDELKEPLGREERVSVVGGSVSLGFS